MTIGANPPKTRPVPRTPSIARRPANLARLAITLFALFAFTLQSFVTQVHVHGTPVATTQSVKTSKGAPEPANCPICQEMLHAGQYVMPSAANFLPLSLVSVAVSTTTGIAAVAQSPSHSWNSRGPPRV